MSYYKYPNARRMLTRMSADHQALFTLAQVEAIEEALTPRTHLIDIRMGFPLFGKGAYCVFIGGPNSRQFNRKKPQELPTAIHSALSNENDIDVNQPQQLHPTAYYLLQRLPDNIMATLEPAQIQAIGAALVARNHLIDIRLSLPFYGKGAYLCFVAGANQRGHYRNIQNRNPFILPAVIASILLGAGSILGLIYIRSSAVLAEPDPVFDRAPKFYQTTVPFKKTQRECMESDRQWIEGKCIDELHDPNF